MENHSPERKRKESDETQIFITKLPLKVTKEEVEDLFDRYGKIVNIVIKDTYVFVVNSISSSTYHHISTILPCKEFEKHMEADEAIYAMHGYNYNGNKLVVEFAGKKRKRGGKNNLKTKHAHKIQRSKRNSRRRSKNRNHHRNNRNNSSSSGSVRSNRRSSHKNRSRSRKSRRVDKNSTRRKRRKSSLDSEEDSASRSKSRSRSRHHEHHKKRRVDSSSNSDSSRDSYHKNRRKRRR